ncbi:hypothetical protein EDF60_1687 [Leucobacter luti]|uniref:hypothetical protein n=1 Tax=Leucobacter luti TaxID=340320 RepID=UPI001045EF52|nr:hypothetical protein [Leucobacter luti]MCW2287036.1 hypothetical protein [Leucobacter luti]TCK41261.1 hypothetical protein EDF60_1687 [Leucobacter luti]
MGADFSELLSLAADIDEASDKLPKYLGKALGVTSKKVKETAASKVSGRKHFRQAASAIDYELAGYTGAVSGMSSEIGYNKDKAAGQLGNLAEFGAPNAGNQLAPGGELQAVLTEHEDDFVAGVERAVADAMGEVGL